MTALLTAVGPGEPRAGVSLDVVAPGERSGDRVSGRCRAGRMPGERPVIAPLAVVAGTALRDRAAGRCRAGARRMVALLLTALGQRPVTAHPTVIPPVSAA